MRLPRYPVPAFRIAKLAVDTRFQGVDSWLLRRTLGKALSVSDEVGLYAVIADAIGEKQRYGDAGNPERPYMKHSPANQNVSCMTERIHPLEDGELIKVFVGQRRVGKIGLLRLVEADWASRNPARPRLPSSAILPGGDLDEEPRRGNRFNH